jgi:hypothetical protein
MISSPQTLIKRGAHMLRKPYNLVHYSTERWLAQEHYHWPHHVLFIAGLPKAGTTWMKNLLGAVPGYKVRWPYDPDNCVYDHDVCEGVFANLPWDLYSVVKLHTRFTPANLKVIEKFGLRTVIMYRDLRDQCISRYFHVLNEPAHRHHKYYTESSKETGLSHAIEITLEEYLPWIQGWLPILAKYPDRFLEVRYEDLRSSPRTVLSRVLNFYEIEHSDTLVNGIVGDSIARTKFNLSANLRKKGKSTARKGIIGDWRNHFTPPHVDRLKAGAGKFLIELGYEKNLEWSV